MKIKQSNDFVWVLLAVAMGILLGLFCWVSSAEAVAPERTETQRAAVSLE